MFEQTNLAELRSITESIFTPEVISAGGKWKLDPATKKRIRRALFGAGKPNGGLGVTSISEQRELLAQFTERVVEPLIESLPKYIAAWSVLLLYEEFVDAVFIQPAWEADAGGSD